MFAGHIKQTRSTPRILCKYDFYHWQNLSNRLNNCQEKHKISSQRLNFLFSLCSFRLNILHSRHIRTPIFCDPAWHAECIIKILSPFLAVTLFIGTRSVTLASSIWPTWFYYLYYCKYGCNNWFFFAFYWYNVIWVGSTAKAAYKWIRKKNGLFVFVSCSRIQKIRYVWAR